MLIKQRAEGGTVILIGFNSGYHDMLLNMVCRLQQLGMNNYVIAAFDADAFAYCQSQVLPCFAVHYDTHPADAAAPEHPVEAKRRTTAEAPASGHKKEGGAAASTSVASSAQAFGTKGFRALTKVKSQQVLRILKLGYDVVWSDVDIFWKVRKHAAAHTAVRREPPAMSMSVSSLGPHLTLPLPVFSWTQVNPIPGMLEEMGDMDIGIQSNAPPDEAADNGRRRINSGFYYVRSSPSTVEAFEQITDHARRSTLSEQPSFYTILCGDELQYVQGPRDCLNTKIPVKTRLLSRQVYPNGAMTDVIRGVTPTSEDKVAIVHFNWLEGHENKVQSFVNASMWMLDEHDQCLYDLPRR